MTHGCQYFVALVDLVSLEERMIEVFEEEHIELELARRVGQCDAISLHPQRQLSQLAQKVRSGVCVDPGKFQERQPPIGSLLGHKSVSLLPVVGPLDPEFLGLGERSRSL